MGTCQSMGVMVEGKAVPEAFKDFIAGAYDQKIASQKIGDRNSPFFDLFSYIKNGVRASRTQKKRDGLCDGDATQSHFKGQPHCRFSSENVYTNSSDFSTFNTFASNIVGYFSIQTTSEHRRLA